MLEITRLTVEHLTADCVTDCPAPHIAFAVRSDRNGAQLTDAELTVGDWSAKVTGDGQTGTTYKGPALLPFTTYSVQLAAKDDAGETAAASMTFETGRMETPWKGQWITDGDYHFTEAKVSPMPMVFRREITTDKPIARARLYATAMGIYEVELNGKKLGDRYFAPGFTSYKSYLQYQTYDVTPFMTGHNTLTATVAGGWAVGSFVFTRKNRVTADRQALLAELRIEYEDGSVEVIGTDSSWQVTEDGPVRMADIYDGETYDATKETTGWHNAAPETLKITPAITAEYGDPVRAHEVMRPMAVTTAKDGEVIYDFGQNFAGVIRMKLNGKAGQVITVRHAEILNPDGTLNTTFLRTAKATATYTCRDGEQEYSPRFSYMGFRYAGVKGIDPKELEIEAVALYSDVAQHGGFHCSDEMLNKLQSNITWSAKSNFVDIPTDCPQRDERMGWTGDINVFAPTALYNFELSRFLEKWLRDVKAEQLPTGGLPNTVPVQGYGFPATMPEMAVDWWGDACVNVPWALYEATGNVDILRAMYPTMQKYVKACRFWAGFGIGKHRYIWHTPAVLHFGDWVAPDVPKMSQWQGRSKYTATASLCNTSGRLAKIARLLGKDEDAAQYETLSAKVADAYCSILTDGSGKAKDEFQTAYVLPLYLNMFPENVKAKAAENLVKLVEKSDYKIGTGFPGTPYILFALADSGHADTAFKMLLNTQCPSWLYEVRVGATTVWERWDGLDENGECPIGDDGTDQMISYNHYASGAVGAFLYRRVLGVEPVLPGYKLFKFAPLVGGGLTEADGTVGTPYGEIKAAWHIENGEMTAEITVPMGTACTVTLPSGVEQNLSGGSYTLTARV
ncbi:glycoside hydrolase family 78 protein [Gemmiger formicilis]|uniref:alpha-L-rhamnosidase n=1 Tax=Gemmiger formicilis TaxID=745368 RepID=UPI00210E68D7|nr:alpha-L-rhamnosidase [Gemmiger formicilis]MCQ5080374.1 glycoside hydrolase family 78 protein [Gemmiger formicilis]MCQ5117069.1 glycoside hydrolase family 78 protein [Gemmiger formicilis]